MSDWKRIVQFKMQAFYNDEEGIGTLEMMLIIAVIIIIAIAFRKWIMRWVQGLFTSSEGEISNTNISGNANSISPTGSPGP